MGTTAWMHEFMSKQINAETYSFMNELINERIIKSLGQEAIDIIKFDQQPQRKSGAVRQSFSTSEEEWKIPQLTYTRF